MINLSGKRAVIFGVASEESIAWAIAKKLAAAGATICLGYQQRFKSRILQLVRSSEIEVEYYERCDVTSEEELATFFEGLPKPVDILVHSIAFANPETFSQRVHEVSKDHFAEALVASSYSLLPLVRHCRPHFAPDASVMTLSYLGGQRVVSNYKLMGVAEGRTRSIRARARQRRRSRWRSRQCHLGWSNPNTRGLSNSWLQRHAACL